MSASRRRDAPATRAAILDAARVLFSTEGLDRVTLRDIAAEAGVDPAMVIRYFGSKDGLFDEAARFDLRLPDLSGVTPDELGPALLPHLFEVWENNAGFLALLRAATTNRSAADKMLDLFVEQVAPALARAAVDRPGERAALLGSQVLGMVLSRYVLRVPPLVRMDRDELGAWLTPVIRYYLTSPAPGAPDDPA
ncbi:TetR/AcrR family transcriptional regulator [Actinokineospora bangkokensis]|uniref:TetR family transcriptional regulator n=1 Tax=Actinokineospora bangkokensis TaxID=1193682 RepID=A0A1Q9LLX4_9PSEU|nr:TetR family transcriptional regulator [Actinokineospora bangkokensis]OLR93015.1 TetR family transcriptional regulator [Actinokineospora bangkokensis]